LSKLQVASPRSYGKLKVRGNHSHSPQPKLPISALNTKNNTLEINRAYKNI
jgi:hypothetical protein